MQIRFLAIVVLAFACAGSPKKVDSAAPPSASAGAGVDGRKLMIIGINDTHGALLSVPPPKWVSSVSKSDIGGADWFAGYLNAIRADYAAKGGQVVVIDAGDEFQGTLISNEFRGRSVTDVYNALGVTASAVGNHEFDFGIPVLKERIAQAKYAVLAANIFLKGTRTRPDWAKPSVLIDQGGIKIGIIGLATQETPLTTNPVNIADLDFPFGGPIAAQEADALRAQGATVVIVTAHAGPYPPDNEIQKIAEAVKGKVDAIVSGHHHTAIGPPPLIVGSIPIVQSGAKLQNFSTIELTLDAANHVRQFAVNDGALPKQGGPQTILHTYNGMPAEWRGHKVDPDGRVASILRDYDVQVKKLRETRIGETAVELRKGGKDDLLANLCADALRSGAGGGLKAQFAFQNSGGLRISEIPAGPITFGQIFDLVPFDNQQVIVSLPANQVRNALEAVLHAGKGPLRVSGMRYTIDWEKFQAKDLKDAPPGAIVTQVVDENSGNVLCETKSCTPTECQSVCEQGTFTVAVTDFLANGGDGLNMLKEAPRQIGSVLARDIIVAFVKEHQPLTAQLLGAMAAGKPARWQQHGAARRAQTGE
ncbi:MAG: bifunctional metallophosphatase/5'-nucleotidase [Myxococcales bacterium]